MAIHATTIFLAAVPRFLPLATGEQPKFVEYSVSIVDTGASTYRARVCGIDGYLEGRWGSLESAKVNFEKLFARKIRDWE